ncbi:hypothetical protein MSG28_005944 [Choristoneura fumiferana]|uniref:Uncharacterized protein n=1 Tax=Choristoneura fumiferana TaxID=7141 RepID=A0ACC0L1P4_CHOFU|nr:hypothetical protein MSG28_005944 [Choristoneura fumiferana]
MTCAGFAAESAAKLKHAKYSALESAYDFVPVAVETAGSWGLEARELFRELGRRLRDRGSDPRSGSYLVQQRKTVRRWIQRYQATGDVKCDRQGPRPVAYTDESERHRNIVQVHSVAPFKSTRSSAETFGVSLSTVRRHLHAANIHNYKPARKIKLTDDHRTSRTKSALSQIRMGEKFCGEEVGRGITQQRIRSQNKRAFNTRSHVATDFKRLTVLGYWGWMSSMGPGELVEIGGRMNSERYLEVLKDVMLPSVRVAYPEGQIYLVHDNSSVHKSKIVKDWLNSQKDITVFEWPAKSPDLNPIENLWGQMVLNWDSSEIRSKKNLDNELQPRVPGGDVCGPDVCDGVGLRARMGATLRGRAIGECTHHQMQVVRAKRKPPLQDLHWAVHALEEGILAAPFPVDRQMQDWGGGADIVLLELTVSQPVPLSDAPSWCDE